MAKLLKLRRGTTSQHSSFTGAEGEVTVDTTKDTIVVHDGSTAGGHPLAKESAALSLIDEDNMSTNSATRPPSQQSVKAYVDAGDAAVPTAITVADESSDTTCFPLFVTAATGDLAPKTGSNFTFNSSTGKVVIGGDLQVQGTTTTVDSTTMSVADKNIEIAKGAANDAAADGAGITVDSGDGDKTWNWVDATDAWTSSEHIHLGDNKKLFLGTGQDFFAVHDGTDTYLRNTGGSLYIEAKSGENAFLAVPDGSTKLYYNGVEKIGTTNVGVTVTGTVTDTKGDVRSIPSNAQGGAYVGVAADAGKAIYISTGGVTINNSVFSAGDAVTIINNSGSDQTITQGSGVTIHNTADAATGNRTLAGRGMATIWFASASVAYISGAGLS
jgi:hypothetical protein